MIRCERALKTSSHEILSFILLDLKLFATRIFISKVVENEDEANFTSRYIFAREILDAQVNSHESHFKSFKLWSSNSKV